MPCWQKKPNKEPEPDCPDIKEKEITPKKPAPQREKELVPA